jgi:hypothetical protein
VESVLVEEALPARAVGVALVEQADGVVHVGADRVLAADAVDREVGLGLDRPPRQAAVQVVLLVEREELERGGVHAVDGGRAATRAKMMLPLTAVTGSCAPPTRRVADHGRTSSRSETS